MPFVFRESETTMLRISYSDSGAQQRWNLCGRLAGPWVNELRACWRHGRSLAPLMPAVVDLSDVTFVDETGEVLLSEMKSAGVTFVAAGVENKHLLENLKAVGERRHSDAGKGCDQSAR